MAAGKNTEPRELQCCRSKCQYCSMKIFGLQSSPVISSKAREKYYRYIHILIHYQHVHFVYKKCSERRGINAKNITKWAPKSQASGPVPFWPVSRIRQVFLNRFLTSYDFAFVGVPGEKMYLLLCHHPPSFLRHDSVALFCGLRGRRGGRVKSMNEIEIINQMRLCSCRTESEPMERRRG